MISRKDIVLVVDDIEINRLILANILEDDFEIIHAKNGKEALDYLFTPKNIKPTIVLLDLMMPEVDGYEVLEKMQANRETKNIPVLIITAVSIEENEGKSLELGAIDFISKPFRPEIVLTRVKNHVKLYKYNLNLEQAVNDKVNELLNVREKLLDVMAELIEYRSLESGEHVKRTKALTQIMLDYIIKNGLELDSSIDLVKDYSYIVKAVPLHDVGKIGIPDNVLLKPGKLTPEEFEIIKTHTIIGSEIVESLFDVEDEKYLKYCYDIVRHHHEKWNGTGYPDKLSEKDIPFAARLVSIIDVYDALVSERVYKKAMKHDEAVKIINEGRGTQFDPKLVEIFNIVENKMKKLKV